MENKSTESSADIRNLTDSEIELTAGAWHKEIKLSNLGMTIFAGDNRYGVNVTSGSRTVTSMHYT